MNVWVYLLCSNSSRMRNKLASKSVLYAFLGYGIGQKSYRCYDSSNQKSYASRNVTFLEHISFYSILVQSHDVTKSEFRTIDPFNIDNDDASQVPDLLPAADPPHVVDPPPTDLPSATHQDHPPLMPIRQKKSKKIP